MKDIKVKSSKLKNKPKKLSDILLEHIPDPEQRAKYEKYSRNHESVIKNILSQIEVKHGRRPTASLRQSKTTG